jgi:hypothetical protein
LPALAAMAVHDETAVGPVVAVPQVVAVHVFAALAATAVHVAIGVGPVVTGAGHVVVVKLLAAVAADAVHAATGTLVVLFVLQVICFQRLPALAVCGVQVKIGVGPVVVFVHVVAV